MAHDGHRLAVFLDEASGACTMPDLSRTYERFVHSFGFTAYAVGFLPGQAGLSGDPFLFIKWPRAWLEVYAREGFASEDAVVAAASTARVPFTWTELQQREPGASERIFAAARRFGWADGLLVPVRVTVAKQFRLGVASLAAPSLSELTPSRRSAVAKASTFAFTRGAQLRTEGLRSSSLSQRETQALSLVASGLGDREVALHMGIKPTTAQTHVEHAKRKLGANSRAQATAFAVSRGLIVVS